MKDKDVFVGAATEKEIKHLKESDRNVFMLSVRAFYKTVCRKLIQTLPLKNELLHDLQFLHPVSKDVSSSETAFLRVSEVLQPFTMVNSDDAVREWRLYRVTNFETSTADAEKYWQTILSSTAPDGGMLFPNMTKVIQCALTIAHGNADTERSFSVTANILTKHRNSLGLEVLNGLMTIKSHVSSAHAMKINEKLLESGRQAFKRYTQRQMSRKSTEQLAQTKKQEDEFLKSFQHDLRENKKISSKEESLQKSKATTEDLRAKAAKLLKQVNETVKIADKLDKENQKKEKELDKIKDRLVKSQLKRSASRPVELASKKTKLCGQYVAEIQDPPKCTLYQTMKGIIPSAAIDYVRGDGNCFFRAVAKDIFHTDLLHEEVRLQVVDHMKEHLDRFASYIDGDPKKHVENMARNGKWATQAEIFATASTFGVEIFVLTPINDKYRWLSFNPEEKKTNCYLTIINTNGDHYDRIVRNREKCNCKIEKPVLHA